MMLSLLLCCKGSTTSLSSLSHSLLLSSSLLLLVIISDKGNKDDNNNEDNEDTTAATGMVHMVVQPAVPVVFSVVSSSSLPSLLAVARTMMACEWAEQELVKIENPMNNQENLGDQ